MNALLNVSCFSLLLAFKPFFFLMNDLIYMPEQGRTGGEVFGDVLFVGRVGLLKTWGPVRCYSIIINGFCEKLV